MTRPDRLIPDDPVAIRRLRAALDSAGFDARNLRNALQLNESQEFLPGDVPLHARRLAGDSPFEVFVRLFWLGLSVDAGDVERALGGLPVDLLDRVGLLERQDGQVDARVRLVPFDPLILVRDRPAIVDRDLPQDHVPGVQPPSIVLAYLTVRRPVDTALDVGTGFGIQALLAARHARQVVATDISARALSFLTFNCLLNGVTNVEPRHGSFFDPVEGERFDLVTCNPPYVISPENRLAYRDGGLRGDGVSRLVVTSLPDHLTEGGYAHALVSWLQGAGQPWHEPVDRWVDGLGCDAWILHLASEDPLTTAAKWNRASGTEDPAVLGEAIDRWVAYYRELGAEAVGYGSVTLRRRTPASGHPNWTRSEDLPAAPDGPAGDLMQRVFAAHDHLADLPGDQALLAGRFRLTERHRLQQIVRPGPSRYEVESTTLVLEDGIPFQGAADPLLVGVLSGLEGVLPLETILANAASRTGTDATIAKDAVLPVVRRLLELGFLDVIAPH